MEGWADDAAEADFHASRGIQGSQECKVVMRERLPRDLTSSYDATEVGKDALRKMALLGCPFYFFEQLSVTRMKDVVCRVPCGC